jgi:hypothetical protein
MCECTGVVCCLHYFTFHHKFSISSHIEVVVHMNADERSETIHHSEMCIAFLLKSRNFVLCLGRPSNIDFT